MPHDDPPELGNEDPVFEALLELAARNAALASAGGTTGEAATKNRDFLSQEGEAA